MMLLDLYTDSVMKKKVEIVKADSVDEANIICKWAAMFQRTEDWQITNNWICSTFL